MTIVVAVLSGPERTRAKAEVALEDAHIPLLPADHHAHMSTDRTLSPLASGEEPSEEHSFLTVATRNVDAAVRAVEPAEWVLRVHRELGDPPQPSPEQILTATIDEMRAEIEALKARVSA